IPQRNALTSTSAMAMHWRAQELRCSTNVISMSPALLADVGKPLEYAKDASGKVVQGTFGQQVRHPFSGVALAYKHGVPGGVLHIIATHSHEGDKVERSIESIIFHHADFVDFDI